MKRSNLFFLTTISVYLSLIFAGTAPTVSALSAQTSSDEKDEKFLQFLRSDFCEAIVEFLKEIKKIGSAKENEKQVIESLERICSQRSLSSFSAQENTRFFEALSHLYKAISSNSRDFADLAKDGCKEIHIKLSYDEQGLDVHLTFSKQSASKATSFVEQFNQPTTEPTSEVAKRIQENTKAFSRNDQILVVTRLPRACIEHLISKLS